MKEVQLKETLEENFGRYAGAVIQSRALIDVRDGLKPSARQLLYAQYIDKLTHDKPFKKSIKSVSSGMAHFYIHGDASAYGTLIRMGKPFATRYPLEDVQGAYGNQMESGNESASRYTEMRLSKLAGQLFKSIDKNTIDGWFDNYDSTEKYPSVLPSIGFYNLVQGTQGIGVALASSVPQFNLREMNEALIKLLWNPEISFEEIYCAPDFATGGIVINGDEIKESLKNGTGPAIKIRSKIEIDYEKRTLTVVELPYGVYTNTICQQLESLIEENPNCGIERFNDLTGLTPNLKIVLTKKANIGKVLQLLYDNTAIQNHFSVNMVMLENGSYPKIFGFKEALQSYLEHAKEVLRKETVFDLDKAEARLHIVEGYLKALSIINEIVSLIKSQKNAATAISALMNNYGFSEIQAKAILDLKLQRLVNMEMSKIQAEKIDLETKINNLKELLADKNKFYQEIEKRLRDVMNEYGDDRRTVITNLSADNEVVEEKQIIAYISTEGAIITKEISDLSTQKRGGVGAKIKFSNKSNLIWKTIVGKTTEQVIFFTNKGKSYLISLSDLLNEEEVFINQFIDLEEDEYITNLITLSDAKNIYKYVIFATKNGTVKKTKVSEYLSGSRKTGLVAIKLREDDQLIGTFLIKNENDKILLTTRKGNCILVEQADFSDTGRNTVGVKGINLNKNDELASMQVIDNSTNYILVATKQGYGKLVDIKEFNICTRATKGSLICKFKEDDDLIADVVAIDDVNKEMIVNTKLSSLRMKINTVNVQSRAATGVQLIKVTKNNHIKYLNLIN